LSRNFRLAEEDPDVYSRETIIDQFNPVPFLPSQDLPRRRATSPTPTRPTSVSDEDVATMKASIRGQIKFLAALGIDVSDLGGVPTEPVSDRTPDTSKRVSPEKGQEADPEADGDTEPIGSKECPKCHRRFSSTYRCLSHFRLKHLQETAYQCKRCKKFLGSKSSLESHVAMHQNTDLDCDECDQRFRSLGARGKHYVAKHPVEDRKDVDNQMIYFCKYCHSAFHTKSIRRQHQDACKCNPGAQRFTCRNPGCTSNYAREKDRNAHEKKRCHFKGAGQGGKGGKQGKK
jgi:hypothetical protein